MEAPSALFVYGTLKERPLIERLLDRRLEEAAPARLPGYVTHDSRRGHPSARPGAPDRAICGLVWPNLTAADFAALDRYEGADRDPPLYRRIRVKVATAHGSLDCYVYEGNPDAFRS